MAWLISLLSNRLSRSFSVVFESMLVKILDENTKNSEASTVLKEMFWHSCGASLKDSIAVCVNQNLTGQISLLRVQCVRMTVSPILQVSRPTFGQLTENGTRASEHRISWLLVSLNHGVSFSGLAIEPLHDNRAPSVRAKWAEQMT